MYAASGAGQRLKAEFATGQIRVDAQNTSVKNAFEQKFFVTDAGRIMRLDSAVGQYNVYDYKTKEFVPCEGLLEGEKPIKYGSQRELVDSLVAKETWGDWFCTKGFNFGAAVGKQVVWGSTMAVVGSAVGPVIGRTVNKAMDSVGYTVKAAPALQEPAVRTGVIQAKAAGINAIRGHAKGTGLAENANGLHAQAQIIHNPPHFPRPRGPFIPRCPVEDPWFPHPIIDPINPPRPCIDPWVPLDTMPWSPWWLRGAAAGGTTAGGAALGAFIGGPVGGVLGGALGAGVGSIFG